VDAKRIHYFQSLYHAEEGWLAATCEQILLYMDMNTRRSAAMPAGILAVLETLLEEHRTLPVPEQAGRVIGIRRR
jgi:acyl-CoA thioester hydrolase